MTSRISEYAADFARTLRSEDKPQRGAAGEDLRLVVHPPQWGDQGAETDGSQGLLPRGRHDRCSTKVQGRREGQDGGQAVVEDTDVTEFIECQGMWICRCGKAATPRSSYAFDVARLVTGMKLSKRWFDAETTG